MLSVSRWRYIAVIIVTLLGIIWAFPNVLSPQMREKIPKFLPHNAINLGLDLQGGSHLLFEVDKDTVYRQRLETVADDISNSLRGIERNSDTKERLPAIAFSGRSVSPDGKSVKVSVNNPQDLAEAQKRIAKLGNPVDGVSGPVSTTDIAQSVNGTEITVSLTEEAKISMTRRAVTQSVEVIRRRIDETGTKEPSITRQGTDRIVVQAPGESDPEKLKKLVGQTAKLTFQMVDSSVSIDEARAGRVPPGEVVLPQDNPSEPFVLVKRRAMVSGENLVDAQPTFDQQRGIPVVSIRFDGTGSRLFGRATTEGVGKRFAIVLDDKVISAPVINEPIAGGNAQISGNFTLESATELSTLLRAGALPAPLKILEQRSVGAELGQDAVNAGAKAGIIALVAVVIFMLLAYGFTFGGFSIIALAVNVILIFAGMGSAGATLTLPGIAGLVLTLGMAVDANVLIYERMREEYAAGRSVALALDAGFSRAVVTIIDAHVTSLLSALILFYFGSGPVRGFAWTLSLGILTSVFTAVLVTQVLIGIWYRQNKPKVLPI
ncbi:MAG: protein translocase subunit SecD [Caulobacterales bacterium]|nr:protein translocase subunit SecD [Caulobacterales bacterium]MCA0371276.1 protein translocase subunit SecD [Pseudomonadota bacterium]